MESDKSVPVTLDIEESVNRDSVNSEMDTESEIISLKKEIALLRKENILLVKRLESTQDSEQEGSAVTVEMEERSSDTPIKFGVSDIKEMIEPFDPSRSMMTVSDWINNIETLKAIYGWDEKSTLFYAVLRLEGAAKLWYQSKQMEIKNWKQFTSEMRRGFPGEMDDSEVLMKIMSRKRKRDESVENYFYSVASLSKRIKLSDYSTINYIISGLGDKNLINVLTAANCTTLPQLLTQIKRYEDIRGQELRREMMSKNAPSTSKFYGREDSDSPSRPPYKNFSGDENRKNIYGKNLATMQQALNSDSKMKRGRNVRCFRCDSIGHIAKECSAQQKKRLCFVCKQGGHEARSCPNTVNSNKRVGKIENNDQEVEKEYYPVIEVSGSKIRAFLDLGSDVTTIKNSVIMNNSWKPERSDTVLYGFGGSKCAVLGKITKNVKIGNVEECVDLLVVPDNSQSTPIIIGKNFLDRPGIKIIKTTGQFEIIREETTPTKDIPTAENGAKNKVYEVRKIMANDVNIHSEIVENDKNNLLNILNEFSECFSNNISDIGETDLINMKIELKEDKIIQYKPYKVPYGLKSKLTDNINDLLSSGIIRHSTSEYSSPVILVPKKNGEYRMCIDYRKLNSITKREQFPVPNIEETLNSLANKKIFTSLDLQSGYYQIPIEESSKHFTAFVTPEGHYEFNRVPFGLTNSPAVFMRLMSKLIEPVKAAGIIVYMDDILVPTETVEENFRILHLLLVEIRKAGLTLNLEKCEFLRVKLEFLGHEITGEGIKPGTKKTDAVANFHRPTTPTEVKQFLGLTGYFRRFVRGYAQIALPLNYLLRRDVKFSWGEREEEAFQQLKAILTQRPILALYDESAQHEVHTDASSHGLAGILMQIGPKDNNLRAVSYFSRATTAAESKYHSYELEALAVVESLERFKHYLLMRRFRVVTDCNSLRMTHEKRDLVPRIARWWLKIQEYDFELVFRSGKQLAHADALSRAPWEEGKAIETVANNILYIGLSQEDWIATLQMQDPRLDEIRKVLEGELKNHKDKDGIKGNYTMKDGRLFKKTDSGSKFVIPVGLRWRIIKSMHDDRGHCGISRTLENIRKHFWFPSMKHVVTKYINSCIDCLYNQRSVDEHRYSLHSQEILPIPFHTVHLDHLGPFPRSQSGNQHVIGFVDAFTKFVVFKPTRTTASRSVMKMLDEICQYFGLPTRIITDRGSAFTSKEFGKYCAENAIKHTKIAVKTPRANGQMERCFRTLIAAIATMTKDNTGRDWDKQVVKIQMALNSSKHSITKRAPQEVLMGYTPRNQIDNKITLVLNSHPDEDTELLSNINLQTIREDVKQRIDSARIKQAAKHNNSTIPPKKYQKGDLVLVKQAPIATGQPKKIQPRFKGPYEVKAVIGNDRYVIVDADGTQIKQKAYESVHSAENLRPWCTLTDISFDGSEEEDDEQQH